MSGDHKIPKSQRDPVVIRKTTPEPVSPEDLLEQIRKPPRHKYTLPKREAPKPLFRDFRKLLDIFQSFGVSLTVNLLLLFLLSLAAVRSTVRREPVKAVIRVSPSDQDTQTEASSSNSSAQKREQKSADTTNPEKTVQEAYSALALSQFSIPALGTPTVGESFSSGAAEFGIGTALGKQGTQLGVAEGQMGLIFEGKGLGDGSEIVLYIDISRSMRPHSAKLTNLVTNLFPRAKIKEVMGCAIVEDAGFVRELESDWSRRTKIFFVCDLRDEITHGGLKKLRSLLLHKGPTKELHIISFENRPILDLKSIVDESWGSISLVIGEPSP
jgi:hypothetical protein